MYLHNPHAKQSRNCFIFRLVSYFLGFFYSGPKLLTTGLLCSLLFWWQPLCYCQQEMQETQAKAWKTLERSCFADLFALFFWFDLTRPFHSIKRSRARLLREPLGLRGREVVKKWAVGSEFCVVSVTLIWQSLTSHVLILTSILAKILTSGPLLLLTLITEDECTWPWIGGFLPAQLTPEY